MDAIIDIIDKTRKNIQTKNTFDIMLNIERLDIALGLLEKGYPLSTNIDSLISRYGNVDDVPEITNQIQIKIQGEDNV